MVKIPLDGINTGKFIALVVIDTVELAMYSTSAYFVRQSVGVTDFNLKMQQFKAAREAQLTWLQNSLQDVSNDESVKWTIVMGHYPI